MAKIKKLCNTNGGFGCLFQGVWYSGHSETLITFENICLTKELCASNRGSVWLAEIYF